jgi:4-amino-4-deoxy-L-arabinose transferase-like glycosyltransferase
MGYREIFFPHFSHKTLSAIYCSLPMKSEYRKSLIIGIIFLAALRVFAARHMMNPDGISYIEIGSAYLQGNFSLAINAWWSPLYAIIIAFPLVVFSVSPYWEFTVVHVINFFIFIFAFACFYFLLQEIKLRISEKEKILPFSLFEFLAYSIFVITSLNVISVALVTPDLLVSGFTYLIVALLLRIGRAPTEQKNFVFLGVALGLGYLTKTPILLLGVVFFAITYIVSKSLKYTALAGIIFLIISACFFVPLSFYKGRFTVGDSGPVNYAWYVNGAKRHIHWQGGDGLGTPVHSTQKILEIPAIYEFAEPVSGMYALWYDPSYWHEGIQPHFDLRQQIANLITNIKYYIEALKRYYIVFIMVLLLLFIRIRARVEFIKNIIKNQWIILCSALVGLGMFEIVLVQNRYVAPFIALLFIGIFAGMRFQNSEQLSYAKKIVFIGSLIVFAIVFYVAGRDFFYNFNEPHAQWQVADELNKMGIWSGDSVAFVGNWYSGLTAYWAHLSGVRIIAEMPSSPDNQRYWHGSREFQQNVIDAFRSTGAKAIVAEPGPYYSSMPGWQKIGITDYFIYRF